MIEDAYKQLKDTEDWRAANDIDVLYNTIDLESYDQSRKLVSQISATPTYKINLFTS